MNTGSVTAKLPSGVVPYEEIIQWRQNSSIYRGGVSGRLIDLDFFLIFCSALIFGAYWLDAGNGNRK
jgi:hypothetical protein